MNQFQVLLLCAGEGRRMLPLTLSKAKPALKVGDESLISRLIMQTNSMMTPKTIWINISHLGNTILDEVRLLPSDSQIRFIFEPKILGSFQTLLFLLRHNPMDTLILHGDLFLSNDYVNNLNKALLEFHDSSFVVYHHRSANNSRSNLTISNGFVQAFYEGATTKVSSRKVSVNSGIYFIRATDINSEMHDSKFAQIYPAGLNLVNEYSPIRAIHLGTKGRISVENLVDLHRANSILRRLT